MENSIVILGAGAAGLAAARELLRAGLQVTLLEARERLGGRLHTVFAGNRPLPIELGAEFIHGERNATWDFVREAGLGSQKVPDQQWTLVDSGVKPAKKFWSEIGGVLDRINPATPDQDFQSFLDQAWGIDPAAKTMARHYVEGFHAAPANQISVHALAQAEEASEQDSGTHQFRITRGYSAVVRWWEEQLAGANIQRGTIARRVQWEPGHVTVEALTPSGQRRFEAARSLITLPLGVLKATCGPAAVVFEPNLPAHDAAIQSLAVASVMKMTFLFRSRFWPVSNFGFIHAPELPVPTWWSDSRGLLLTGWAGGPKAEKLGEMGSESGIEQGIGSLAILFKTDAAKVREHLIAVYYHDWLRDPFTLGAYSYTPARMSRMGNQLGRPVGDTLFFAGEATNTDGDQGTVHGAIATGLRAAKQILEAARRPQPQAHELQPPLKTAA